MLLCIILFIYILSVLDEQTIEIRCVIASQMNVQVHSHFKNQPATEHSGKYDNEAPPTSVDNYRFNSPSLVPLNAVESTLSQ